MFTRRLSARIRRRMGYGGGIGAFACMRVARGATYLFLQGIVSNLAGVVYFAFAARLLPNVAGFGSASS